MSNNYNKMHGKPIKRKNRTYDTLDQKVRAWEKNVEHYNELMIDMVAEYEAFGMILRVGDEDHYDRFERLSILTAYYEDMIDKEQSQINELLSNKIKKGK